ncbi:MAG TPA: hypothetical protein VMS32_01890 [Verrucomicrobiae bacterium]|nr:hypothetical protein [Verrucomicrobiae bacterium]
MSKRIVAIVVLIGVAALFIGGAFMSEQAVWIDEVHWHGDPVQPCFVNAALCGGHVLGTDEVGRDLAARLIVGARVSLGISLLAVVSALVFGVIFGAMARYGGVYLRFAMLRFLDALSCFVAWPLIVLIVTLTWRPGEPGLNWSVLAAIAGLLFSPHVARLTTFGEPTGKTVRLLADRAARDWGSLILLLATVDFFRHGVQPPTPSWGNIILIDGAYGFSNDWWIEVFPAVCIFIAVLFIELGRRAFLAPVYDVALSLSASQGASRDAGTNG